VHVAISTGPRVCGAGTADGRDRYRKQRLHPNHALAASNETTLVRRSHVGSSSIADARRSSRARRRWRS